VIFFRKLHKWLGLLIGLQVLVWVLSGAIISLLDARTVSGGLTRQVGQEASALAGYGSLVAIGQLPLSQENVRSITLDSFSHARYIG